MKKITPLIKSMTPHEVRVLSKYYAASGKKEVNLKLKLFDLVRNNGILSDNEAAGLLGKKNNAAFSMVKYRLEQDIIKILIWEHDLELKPTKKFRVKFQAILLILEIEILSYRGVTEMIEEKLKRAHRLAAKYELTRELVLINEYVKIYFKRKKGSKIYKNLATSNNSQVNLLVDIFQAEDFFDQLMAPIRFEANQDLDYIKNSKVASEHLRQLAVKSKSVNIEYLYLRSQIYYNHLIFDYPQAEKFALKFIKFINENPIHQAFDNYLMCNVQLSIINMHMAKYEKSIKYVKAGFPYALYANRNYAILAELNYRCCIFKGDYDDLLGKIQEVKSFPVAKPGTHLHSIWLYYEANLYFKQKKYKEAMVILKRQNTLTDDKSGWRVGFKILEMLCIIEMENYDWLEYRIESFRKLLASVKKENMARPKIAYEMLRMLMKENFNYALVTKKLNDKFELLKRQDYPYRWDPHAWEIIRFDGWWDEKLKAKQKKIA